MVEYRTLQIEGRLKDPFKCKWDYRVLKFEKVAYNHGCPFTTLHSISSKLYAEEMHLYVIKYHQICQIPGSFVKHVKYLSNITVFDRKYLMKK